MPSRHPMWRVLDGIERDLEDNISPWLRSHVIIPGDPPDRAKAHFRTLLDIVRGYYND